MNMFYNIVIDVDYYLSLVYQLTIGTHLRRGTHDHVHVSWVQFMIVVDQTWVWWVGSVANDRTWSNVEAIFVCERTSHSSNIKALK